MKESIVSRRTIVTAAIALVGPFLLFYTVHFLSARGAESASLWVSDFGEAAFVGLAAAFIVYAAYRFDWTRPPGRHWLLIGVGVALFAVGDVAYGYYEVLTRSGEVPYPGLPDVFYLLSYVFLAWGLIGAALGYRRLVNERSALIVAIIVSVAALVAMWFFVFAPVLAADAEVGVKVLGLAYPIGDVLLEFGPALFIALVVRQLGGGRLAWPWFVVALGIAVTALADAGYSVLAAHNLYQSGAWVDIGWPLGYALVAVGASVARDVFGI